MESGVRNERLGWEAGRPRGLKGWGKMVGSVVGNWLTVNSDQANRLKADRLGGWDARRLGGIKAVKKRGILLKGCSH